MHEGNGGEDNSMFTAWQKSLEHGHGVCRCLAPENQSAEGQEWSLMKTCTRMFIAALFIIQKLKQSKCQWRGKQVIKMSYSYSGTLSEIKGTKYWHMQIHRRIFKTLAESKKS